MPSYIVTMKGKKNSRSSGSPNFSTVPAYVRSSISDLRWTTGATAFLDDVHRHLHVVDDKARKTGVANRATTFVSNRRSNVLSLSLLARVRDGGGTGRGGRAGRGEGGGGARVKSERGEHVADRIYAARPTRAATTTLVLERRKQTKRYREQNRFPIHSPPRKHAVPRSRYESTSTNPRVRGIEKSARHLGSHLRCCATLCPASNSISSRCGT